MDNKPISFDRYYDMTAPDFDELVAGKEHIKNIGAKIEKLVHKMPRLAAEATILPITRSVLSVELALTPDFMYDETVHGGSQGFHLLIEDSDGEQILYYQYWVLKKKYAQETQYVNFIIPLIEPMPPHYYLRICSDTWLKAETTHLISFRSLILPEKFPPHTELLDLQPLPLHALNNEAFERVLGGTLTTFNPIQTQVFSTVYESDANVLVAARSGAGKGVIGELALLRLFAMQPGAKALYVCPVKAVCEQKRARWQALFAPLEKTVGVLSGDAREDTATLAACDVVIALPEHLDAYTNRGLHMKLIQVGVAPFSHM